MHHILASVPGLGQIGLCGNCDDVHLVCGNIALRLPKEAFLALCRMTTAAAGHPRLAETPDAPCRISFKDGLPEFRPLSGDP